MTNKNKKTDEEEITSQEHKEKRISQDKRRMHNRNKNKTTKTNVKKKQKREKARNNNRERVDKEGNEEGDGRVWVKRTSNKKTI